LDIILQHLQRDTSKSQFFKGDSQAPKRIAPSYVDQSLLDEDIVEEDDDEDYEDYDSFSEVQSSKSSYFPTKRLKSDF
jgi:hypothetical protein